MIEVEDLRFIYAGNADETLKGLSFDISEGEIFGFLGPSGAGKSTTQKILIGLLKEYQGNYTIMGKRAVEWSRDLYEHIGVAFEHPNLYARFSARENLSYFASFYRRPCRSPLELLEQLGLGDAVDRRVDAYSKGMRTRLNLARALMHDPEILFLDEPTSGLDPANARMVIELIKEYRLRGKTIFLTTHNMSVAEELCDNLGFIVDGQVNCIGHPPSLKLEYGERILRIDYLLNGRPAAARYALDGIGRNEEFLTLIRDLDEGEIRRIHSGEASMEEVFMKVTGKMLT